jgi:hypothetical protein
MAIYRTQQRHPEGAHTLYPRLFLPRGNVIQSDEIDDVDRLSGFDINSGKIFVLDNDELPFSYS